MHVSSRLIPAALLLLAGCATKAQTGAVIGASGGAVVGGAAGADIRALMDKQAKELEQNIEGATVERIGEGIKVTFASGLMYDFNSDVVRPEAVEVSIHASRETRATAANPGTR